VLYQLARAHELDGEPEAALATLDRLVASYPATRYLDEAQFRRGELLFTARQYPAAEQAYSAVLARAEPTVFHDRALYMQGWSRFKQGQLDGALEAFLRVLDGKLADQDPAVPLEQLDSLSRADRELLDDSFRVVSLTLENLQGAASIPPVTASPARQHYQVRLYRRLAALYLQQDRPKDAADTLLAFTRLRPEDAQAPALQDEVIGIYAQAGFAQQAQQVKVDFVTRYGAQGPTARPTPKPGRTPSPRCASTWPSWPARPMQAQQSHAPADVAQAVQWYRTLLADFPDHPETAENRFLMAELLFEAHRFDEAALAYTQTAYPASTPRLRPTAPAPRAWRRPGAPRPATPPCWPAPSW
jgi:tetratricopeptide (TPR) repeat protein